MNVNRITDLREKLVKNLKRLIGNPVIEAKELAAFDLIMDRRQFLKAAQFAAVGALVASACPPTAWGRYDRKLHVDPGDVGLTDGEQASVSIPTQIVSGTELFQDTIYAQPVVSEEGFESRGLVEGARGWSRLQSDLSSTDPQESQFLDTDYHFGPPELIQIEQDTSGSWEVVHYRRPWSARLDGARTDGLVRDVIMTEDDGLDSPTKVIPVTGTFTNYFVSAGSDQQSYLTYAVFIQQSSGHHYIAIGTGLLSVSPPYDTLPDYPVQWTYRPLSDFGPKASDTLIFTDKYTESVWQSDFDAGDPDALAQYDPRQSHEHILLYYDEKIIIISMLDSGGTDEPNLTISKLPYPSSSEDARVIHIDWDYSDVDNVDNWRALKTVTVARSETDKDDNASYYCYAMQRGDPTSGGKDVHTFSSGITWVKVDYDDKWKIQDQLDVPLSDLQDGTLYVDYSALRSVNGLYSLAFGGYIYHAKLANISGRGIFALTFRESTDDSGDPIFELFGHFPLAFPDGNGLGTITTFFGGTSKFGGLRFVAGDADGNLFLMRQRGAQTTSTPYAPPIYGLYDADGTPLSTIDAEDDPLPTGTASTSNLQDLGTWVRASTPGDGSTNYLQYSYNMLLQTALAFGTDDTNLAQAVWLGTGYQAAYATKRFGLDSDHVVVRLIQSGDSDVYSAIAMFKNPVDKTWRQRVIASQTLPADPGENETGDHYQATLTPANAYGKAVSLTRAPNTNLRIEVRADSPCTVTDDTNNLYHEVDRYTSFMASPDPTTGQLNLVVKADVFSQVLYVRLVDTSQLEQSSDAALLRALEGAVYPWQSLNLAAQAQQRMGNDGTASSLPGDSAPLVDTSVYVSADTLSQSNQNNSWQTKGNYQPTTDNLTSLGSYLNTSGQNLISATGQLSLGASADGVTIDPLYAVTAVPVDQTRATVTTQFAYDSGSVTTTTSAPSMILGGAPGSAFGSVSHALHDALHWLQHAEAKFYKDLSSGGVIIASAADGITVTISKDIMKQVNGVEQALENEVVTTVEEYASIVVNVVVTIVEESFIYQFIALMIALISLFLYFGDVLALSKSFKNFFEDLFSGANGESIPVLPSSFSSEEAASPYLGPGNSINDVLGGVDSSGIETELTQDLLDAIFGNPLTKKILNKVMAAISDVLNDVSLPLPLSFQMDQTLAQDITDDIENLEASVVSGTVNLVEDTAVTLIEQLAADIANPQQTYENLASGLGPLADEIASDALTPVFDFVDTVAVAPPTVALDMIGYDDYITLKIPMLADLCKLFGIGSVSGAKLNLKAHEAVFFPLALIVWVAVYESRGKSIDSVDALESTLAAVRGGVGGSESTQWNVARLVVDYVLTELGGFVWTATANVSKGDPSSEAVQTLAAAGAWFNWIRWFNDFVYTCKYWNPNTGAPWDYANTVLRLATASANVVFTLPGKNLNPGDGWPLNPRRTDISQCINFCATCVVMGLDTDRMVEAGPDANQSLAIAGQDFARSQGIAAFLYNYFSLQAYLEYFALYILTAPFGFQMQIEGLEGGLSSTGPGGSRKGHFRHHRRRHRPHPRHRGRGMVRNGHKRRGSKHGWE